MKKLLGNQKVLKTLLLIVMVVNSYSMICFASGEADAVAESVTGGMNAFIKIIVRIVQLVGAVLMVKNVADFGSAWKQSDDSGMFSAGKGIAGAAILLGIELILKLFGVNL